MFLSWQLLEQLIPNGCELVHYCSGPENEHQAWYVCSVASEEILASAPTARGALLKANAALNDEDWWRGALADVDMTELDDDELEQPPF